MLRRLALSKEMVCEQSSRGFSVRQWGGIGSTFAWVVGVISKVHILGLRCGEVLLPADTGELALGGAVPKSGAHLLQMEMNWGGAYPFALVRSLWKSGLQSSQKYSSGLAASSMMPTQPPCCQTLQMSHWMNRPPASSVGTSESANEDV